MFFPKTVCKVSEIGDKKMVPFSNETLSNKRTTSRPERTSVVTFREERKGQAGARGSLTIEAALVLPIVVFVLLGFSYFFRIMSLQTRIAETLNRAVEEITACVPATIRRKSFASTARRPRTSSSCSRSAGANSGASQIVPTTT